jgi:hypothetical protein
MCDILKCLKCSNRSECSESLQRSEFKRETKEAFKIFFKVDAAMGWGICYGIICSIWIFFCI